MVKSRTFPGLALLLFALMLATVSVCFGEGQGRILFEEDFRGNIIDEKVWVPGPNWKITDGVLETGGGGDDEDIGFTVRNDFTDFEFSVDFNMIAVYAIFVMRAIDIDNLYIHRIDAGVGEILWQYTLAANWTFGDPKPFEKAPEPESDVWYRIKFIVEGKKFTCLMAELGEELNETDHLVGVWENNAFADRIGSIGFAGERAQFDNALVTTIGYVEPVSPGGRLLTVWGKIKSGR